MQIISAQKDAKLAGVLIALDRQEKGKTDLSAIQEVERDYNTKVFSIITLSDLITYIAQNDNLKEHLASVSQYLRHLNVLPVRNGFMFEKGD